MTSRFPLIALTLALVVLLVGSPAEAGDTKLDDAALDRIFPRTHAGMGRRSAVGAVTSEGRGRASATYGYTGRRETEVRIRVDWVEDRGAAPRLHQEGPQPGYRFDYWIHPQKHVVARYDLSQNGWTSFAKRVADMTAPRAASWAPRFRHLPWRSLQGFQLQTSMQGTAGPGIDEVV